MQVGRYFHARQARRARREIRRLKIFLGRVYRDTVRKIEGKAELQAVFSSELGLADRLLTQQQQDKNKLYSLHAPEVECIGKGKAHKKYEFGVKVSVAVSNRDNFVVACWRNQEIRMTVIFWPEPLARLSGSPAGRLSGLLLIAVIVVTG